MDRSLGTVVRVTGLVLLLDLVTKVLTVTRLEDAPLDLGWVTLRSARNTGISFSIGAGAPTLVVTLVTGAAVLAIAWFAVRGLIEPPLAAGLLLGGGLGNFLDRLDDGAVVDMVDLGWFPVFNVADIALNAGVAVVLLWGLTHRDEPGPDVDDQAVVPSPGSAAPLDDEPAGPPTGGA